jgi:hypothetical protein
MVADHLVEGGDQQERLLALHVRQGAVPEDTLTEQRERSPALGAGLKLSVQSHLLTGRAEQSQQGMGDSREQEQPVARADVRRRRAQARVSILFVLKGLLNRDSLAVQRADVLGGALGERGSQALGLFYPSCVHDDHRGHGCSVGGHVRVRHYHGPFTRRDPAGTRPALFSLVVDQNVTAKTDDVIPPQRAEQAVKLLITETRSASSITRTPEEMATCKRSTTSCS